MAKVKQIVNKETGEKESAESLIRRFKKAVLAEGIIADYRKHEFFVPKSVKKREKSLANQRKLLKK